MSLQGEHWGDVWRGFRSPVARYQNLGAAAQRPPLCLKYILLGTSP
jgi:hypothetical protein